MVPFSRHLVLISRGFGGGLEEELGWDRMILGAFRAMLLTVLMTINLNTDFLSGWSIRKYFVGR
jgi:hypothetical protein